MVYESQRVERAIADYAQMSQAAIGALQPNRKRSVRLGRYRAGLIGS
jgi:hypothetical protein